MVTVGPGWSTLLADETRLLQQRSARCGFVKPGAVTGFEADYLGCCRLFPPRSCWHCCPRWRDRLRCPQASGLGSPPTSLHWRWPRSLPSIRVPTCFSASWAWLPVSALRQSYQVGSNPRCGPVGHGCAVWHGSCIVSLGLVLLLPTVYSLFISGNGLAVVEAEFAQA